MERSIPDHGTYEMMVSSGTAAGSPAKVLRFRGPHHGIGAIWHRYRGPRLSDDPAENALLLDEPYHVGAVRR
jgi:hypothetical protein